MDELFEILTLLDTGKTTPGAGGAARHARREVLDPVDDLRRRQRSWRTTTSRRRDMCLVRFATSRRRGRRRDRALLLELPGTSSIERRPGRLDAARVAATDEQLARPARSRCRTFDVGDGFRLEDAAHHFVQLRRAQLRALCAESSTVNDSGRLLAPRVGAGLLGLLRGCGAPSRAGARAPWRRRRRRRAAARARASKMASVTRCSSAAISSASPSKDSTTSTTTTSSVARGVLGAQDLLVELADAGLRDALDEASSARAATTWPRARRGSRVSSSALAVASGRSTTQHSGRSCHFSSGTAITAASKTAGWAMTVTSSSTELIHSPPDLMTSFVRSLTTMKPSPSSVPMSPGAQPAVAELLGVVDAEVRAGDPGPADLELADRLAVARQARCRPPR